MKSSAAFVLLLVACGALSCGGEEKTEQPPVTGAGQCLAGASVRAALAEQSRTQLAVLWDRDAGRPAMVSGTFRTDARSPEGAAREFLSRHADGLHLAADGSDLALRTTRRGLVGTYLRFQQQYRGVPVFGGEVVVHVVAGGAGPEVRDVALGHFDGVAVPQVSAEISASHATRIAVAATGATGPVRRPASATLGIEPQPAPRLAWLVQLTPATPPRTVDVLVDARSGEVFSSRDRLQHVDGTGLVFDPNPIASTGNFALGNNNGRTTPELDAARVRVTLPRLDGSGLLRGPFVDSAPDAAVRANEPSFVYDYDRADGRFGQVMAYFHVDRVQARIQQLGFTNILNRPFVVNVGGTRDDNSFYDPATKEVTTGTGGVPDAEDADVLVHEYGHAIQDDQAPGFGYGEQGGMGEGFGDYLAAAIAQELSPQVIDPACVGEWDVVEMSLSRQCLRRVDGTRHYPEGLKGEVHDDGIVWSGALWRMRAIVGAEVADKLVLESHFLLSRRADMERGAAAIKAADRNLFGGAHEAQLERLFLDLGLSRTLTPPADLQNVVQADAVDLQNPRSRSVYRDNLDHSLVVTRPGALGLRLHFERLDTETGRTCHNGEGCDNVYLLDAAGNLFQILFGSQRDVYSVVVPGDTIRVRLVSDAAVGRYGYKIDRVEQMGTALCGDGVRATNEACDGADFGPATCGTLGYASGTLACRKDCTVDASDCTGSATCGNGKVDGPGEECDGADVGTATCTALGFAAGTPACTADCRVDASGCSTCGNGKREGAEACDGADAGGKDCLGAGFAGGVVRCSAACTLDTSACAPAQCR